MRRDEGELLRADARFVERGGQRSPHRLHRAPQACGAATVREAGQALDASVHGSVSRSRLSQRLQHEGGGPVARDEAVPPRIEGSEGARSLPALGQEPQRIQIEQRNERAPNTGPDHDRDVGLFLKHAPGGKLQRLCATGGMAGERRIGPLQLIAAGGECHEVVRETLEEEEGVYGMERRSIDALGIEHPVGHDPGLAEGRIEVAIPRLAVVGGADVERLSLGGDLRHLESRGAYGLIDGPEPEPRARADQPSLLEHVGRCVGRQRIVVHSPRVAEGPGQILAAELADAGRPLEHSLPVTLE